MFIDKFIKRNDFNALNSWLIENDISKIRTRKELAQGQELIPITRLSEANSENAIKVANKLTFKESEFETIFKDLKNYSSIENLGIVRKPADYIAAYYPFHSFDINTWGIVIDVQAFLEYIDNLAIKYSNKSIPKSLVARLAMFEIFHHEYFHHIVECMCTVFEILHDSNNSLNKIYLLYNAFADEQQEIVKLLPDEIPLEEALANAYAYNSFTFISKMKKGYKTMLVKYYQKSLEYYWKTEPSGYRAAGKFIEGNYLYGAEKLIKLILPALTRKNNPPFEILAKEIFPNGNSTFFSKQNIPLFLQGFPNENKKFITMFGDVRFFCTNIFSKYDDMAIENKFYDYISIEKRQNKKR